MFFITHTEIGEGFAVIIKIEGPLNSETSPDFDDYIWKLIENNIIFILIDMEKLNFISSEGIGAALLVEKNINKQNGLAVFYNLNYEVASLFKLLGFDKIFTVAEDMSDALQILDRHMELYTPTSEIQAEINEVPEEISDPVIDKNQPTEEITGFPDIIENENAEQLFVQFVIECVKCKSLIRIKEPGEQLCPFCNAEFSVTGEQKAEFVINDNPQ